MPLHFAERFPLPSLKTYTTISGVLFFLLLVNNHIRLKSMYIDNGESESKELEDQENGEQAKHILKITRKSDGYLLDILALLLEDTFGIWILVNTAYCCLLLFGKLIQNLVFGELRVVERHHLNDKFWNFVFYKFIFIFGVMNVQTIQEVALWCAWFSLLLFLSLLTQLCKDRFQYLCSSPATTHWTHTKVMALLVAIEATCIILLCISILVGLLFAGLSTFAFMAAECLILVIKCSYVIVRYSIHLWDLSQEGIWENRAIYVYYSELIFEMAVVIVDFMHHLHMLLWGNIFLSMASLVICMQLRFLFYEFQRRIRRHKNYIRVVNSMETKFPLASKQQLEESHTDCAICWEKLEIARVLPCGHLFHNSCLRSWLEQDTTCPTCRKSLSVQTIRNRNEGGENTTANTGPRNIPTRGVPPQANRQQLYNHFFHFDGSRYVSWLPSFSVEVTHTTLLGDRAANQPVVHDSQLDNMARQVREVFPDVNMTAVVDDLQRTHSVQLTLENIIEGNLPTAANQSFSNSVENTVQNSSERSEGLLDGSSSNNQDHSSTTNVNNSHSISDVYETNLPESYSRPGPSVVSDPTDELANVLPHLETNIPTMSESSRTHDVRNYEDDQFLGSDSVLTSGSRFSKSPAEREAMLNQRKKKLLDQAKHQFLASQEKEKKQSNNTDGQVRPKVSSSSTLAPTQLANDDPSSGHELRHRRQLAYEAACRRLQQN